MHMASFILRGLAPDTFAPLFLLPDVVLSARQMQRLTVPDTATTGFPCRISLVDAQPGEQVLLLPYQHQPAESPYRASGPIFVRRGARSAVLGTDEVPATMLRRLLSVRAYDHAHRIIAAEVCEGTAVAAWLQARFDDRAVDYVHVHHARYGCYSCRADRA
jgi:hypothetical protein